uniref:Copper transporter n=1 Tax=Mycena chlorophos TaxID=658473 RepID=A0ABQ0LXL1_MYCCL|nr:predicted protein [Mycena chlorophos]
MSTTSYGDVIHWSLGGEHVLFAFISLDSLGGFLAGAFVTVVVCACERLLTYASDRRWELAGAGRSRGTQALWRAGMYWILALLRLAYMLIAMTRHSGLILLAATTLAAGQFLIELRTGPEQRTLDRDYAPLILDASPLLPRRSIGDDRQTMRIQSHDSQSKIEDGFLANGHEYRHGIGLGIDAGVEESVRAWQSGAGPEAARALLGTGGKGHHVSRGSRSTPFQIGAGEDSDGN